MTSTSGRFWSVHMVDSLPMRQRGWMAVKRHNWCWSDDIDNMAHIHTKYTFLVVLLFKIRTYSREYAEAAFLARESAGSIEKERASDDHVTSCLLYTFIYRWWKATYVYFTAYDIPQLIWKLWLVVSLYVAYVFVQHFLLNAMSIVF